MTNTLVSNPPSLVSGFDEAVLSGLLKSSGPALSASRKSAFEEYAALPMPTNQDEEWRRTSLELFPFGTVNLLPLLGKVGRPSGSINGPMDHQFDAVVEISETGYCITSTGLPSGVLLLPLAEAFESHPELVQKHFQKAVPPSFGKFAVLNTAFWNAGFFVHIPDRVVVPKGILFHYRIKAAGVVIAPRLLVVAGAGSETSIVEHFESPDETLIQCVAAKEFFVEQGGKLKVFSVQEWGNNTCLIDNDMAVVRADARIDYLTLNFGTKVSKQKFGSDVAGPHSVAEMDGIYFASGHQHLEQTTWQIHSSPDTYSRLLYKGAVKEKARSVYRGVIQAKPKCIRVDAYQTNNNLVLTDGARAETIPGLLIDADDLKCSHGATIGNLDENQVFYLRSRGISDAEARKIVILGYFDEIVERIPYEFLRDRIHAHIEAKLA